MQLRSAVIKRVYARSRAFFVAVVMSLLVSLGCKYSATGNQHARPDALIVLPGAVAVQDTNENEATVLYQLNEEYPAELVTEAIRSRLEMSGWQPLREDFLNPGLPTSLVRGWVNYEERTKERPTQRYQWVGQWEDDSKRIVWYVLTYDGVSGPASEIRPQGPLNVRATLLSAEAVKNLGDAVKKRPVPK